MSLAVLLRAACDIDVHDIDNDDDDNDNA